MFWQDPGKATGRATGRLRTYAETVDAIWTTRWLDSGRSDEKISPGPQTCFSQTAFMQTEQYCGLIALRRR